MSELKLTPKQEKFCLAYIETGNASEAYRQSYDASRSSESSVNRKAKELLDNGKVAARIAEMRAPAVVRAQVTLENHLNDLKRLRDAAEKEAKYGPAIQAEIARGRASGLYIEKIERADLNGITPVLNLTIAKAQEVKAGVMVVPGILQDPQAWEKLVQEHKIGG